MEQDLADKEVDGTKFDLVSSNEEVYVADQVALAYVKQALRSAPHPVANSKVICETAYLYAKDFIQARRNLIAEDKD